MVEGDADVGLTLELELGGVLGEAVIGFAEEDGGDAGWDDDGHGLADAVPGHVGDAEGDGFVGLVGAVSGELDFLACGLGECSPVEAIGVGDDGDDELITGEGDSDAELDVVIGADAFSDEGAADDRVIGGGLGDGEGKEGEGAGLEVAALIFVALAEGLDGSPVGDDGHHAGDDHLVAAHEAAGEDALLATEGALVVGAALGVGAGAFFGGGRLGCGGCWGAGCTSEECVHILGHELGAGGRDAFELGVGEAELFGVGAGAGRDVASAFAGRGGGNNGWSGWCGGSRGVAVGGGGVPGGIFGAENEDFGADGKNIVHFGKPAHDGAAVGTFDIHDGLVGFHLVDGFVAPDGVADLLEFGDETGFLEAFADLGDAEGDFAGAGRGLAGGSGRCEWVARDGDRFSGFDQADFSSDGEDVVYVGEPADEGSGDGGFDIHDGLVGLHLVDGFVSSDGVAGFFEEGDDSGFLQAFTDLGDAERLLCHGCTE